MPLSKVKPTTIIEHRGGYRPGAGRKKKLQAKICRVRVSSSIHNQLSNITAQMNAPHKVKKWTGNCRYWMFDAFAQIMNDVTWDAELIHKLLRFVESPDSRVLPPGQLIQVKEADFEQLIRITQIMQQEKQMRHVPPISLAASVIILYHQSLKKLSPD